MSKSYKELMIKINESVTTTVDIQDAYIPLLSHYIGIKTEYIVEWVNDNNINVELLHEDVIRKITTWTAISDRILGVSNNID